MGVNKVILIGNLGKDPELKYTPSGQAVVNFSLATTEVGTSKDGNKQEYTEWHRIVAWGKLAETCGEYLSKGKSVYIEGSLRTRSWEKDGSTRWTTEVIARTVQFLSPAGERQSQGSRPKQEEEFPSDFTFDEESSGTDDDIPF